MPPFQQQVPGGVPPLNEASGSLVVQALRQGRQCGSRTFEADRPPGRTIGSAKLSLPTSPTWRRR